MLRATSITSRTGSRRSARRGGTTRGSSWSLRRPSSSRCTTTAKPSHTIWVNPSDALEQHRNHELELIFPTIRNLEAISRFDTAADLLAAAAAIDEVVTMLPKVVSDATGMRILLPGDPGYDEVIDGKLPEGVTGGRTIEGREIAR